MKKVSKLKALDKFDITQKVIFPSTEKLKELRNNIVKYMEQEYFLTLPSEAQLLIKNHPQFCQIILVIHLGHTTRDYFYIKSINDDFGKSKESQLLFSPEVVANIDVMVTEYDNYRKEVDKLEAEVEKILKLPVKQIVEKFPDIAKHIPEKEDLKDVESINLKIKNQPL
jgi:hypothetical protein